MVDTFKKGKGNKPIYEPYDNTDKVGLMVMKLIASGDENDKLEFPHFVGSGFIENYAVDVNGQLDTTLKLGPRETVKLGTSGKGLIPTGVDSSASKVTDEIAAKLMG